MDVASVTATRPAVVGHSKSVWMINDGLCLVELRPSLSSFTYGRYEHVPGTEVLRLDFFELAIDRLRSAGIEHAFGQRVGPAMYTARWCTAPPFEVIVKNAAQGSTTRKYPGLFPAGHRFEPPVVKFDFRIDPEDQPIADDYVRAAGWPVDDLKAIALGVNSTVGAWLAPRELLDFCVVVGRDSTGRLLLLSEISPDCMRLRDTAGHPLDKDLFRHGASHEEIIATWTALVADVTIERSHIV